MSCGFSITWAIPLLTSSIEVRPPDYSFWRHPWDFAFHVRHKALNALPPSRRQSPVILGISINAHDPSFVLARGGYVLAAIELERFHRRKHFALQPSNKNLKYFTTLVFPVLVQLCAVAAEMLPSCTPGEYDIVSYVEANGFMSRWLEYFIQASAWVYVDHHHAHAASGWLDSPFYHSEPHANDEVTVILSYDGFGNDGKLRTFIGRAGNATLLPLGDPLTDRSFGFAYLNSAALVRDLAWGSPYGSQPPGRSSAHSLPGAFMAYAATGRARSEWRAGARVLLSTVGQHLNVTWDNALWPSPHGGDCVLIDVQIGTPHAISSYVFSILESPHYFSCGGANEEQSREHDRDFAATVQQEFEQVVLAEMRARLSLLDALVPKHLVIVGGCALNVKVNSMLARELDLPVHIPPAPNDSGLGVGAVWLIHSPVRSRDKQNIRFSGAPLIFDKKQLNASHYKPLALRFGGIELKSVSQLAELLIKNGSIVGVARGRAELGPRALGHRSFLSSAKTQGHKQRLNRLKNRRWYRPCAPILLEEDLLRVFEPGPDLAFGSPYMSVAPPLRAWAEKSLPGIAHLDGTARPQGVSKADDPWMHSLLEAVRTATKANARQNVPAVGVLINTSLNPKGEPIASSIVDVLVIFCMPGGEELDYILLEERWLIKRSTAVKLGLCEKLFQKGREWKPADGLPTI